MGQYHHLYAYSEATQGLRRVFPYDLARGVKAWEQLDGNVGNALAWLLAVAPGDAPADLLQFDPTSDPAASAENGSVVIGSWAGARILEAGDYAEDEDIADWNGPAISKIYQLRGFGQWKPSQLPEKDNWNRDTPRPEWRTQHERWLEERHELMRYLPVRDDSKAVQHVIARVKHLAFKGSSAWLNEEPCKWDDGFNKRHVARGQKRVILNLDRNEYLDPVAFGAKPTTAGMVLNDRFGDALLTAVFHASCRGGGDLPEDHKLPEAARGWIGRWHGARLIATPEKPAHPTWPTTAAVKASATDMSQLAKELVDFLHTP